MMITRLDPNVTFWLGFMTGILFTFLVCTTIVMFTNWLD